jgi:ribosomal protein S12 methylthiotransferase accessory factor
MLFDAIPFDLIWKRTHANKPAVPAFIHFLEKKLGARFFYDGDTLPRGQADLADTFETAAQLTAGGIIQSFSRTKTLPDEPPIRLWNVQCGTSDRHVTGGIAISDDRSSLVPALAEATERFLWFETRDYFRASRRATTAAIKKTGACLAPEIFAGFSETQRTLHKSLSLCEDSLYEWIRGTSLVSGETVMLPAQVVSGLYGIENQRTRKEPVIIVPITSGLATGPTREFARLNGILEILERDAFMITWMNHLSPRRIAVEDIRKKSKEFDVLCTMCEQYYLTVTIVRLVTDAPTYAIGAIVEDKTGIGPAVTVGLKAHRSLAHAARGAVLEALRMRHTVRWKNTHTPLDGGKKKEELVHIERAQYWADESRKDKISFLIEGEQEIAGDAPWEHDSLSEHLCRLQTWCADNDYSCVSVDMGVSKRNTSPWFVEMVVMPQMQPIHQTEHLAYLGGIRLQEVPAKLGFTVRDTPYMEEPHPFA